MIVICCKWPKIFQSGFRKTYTLHAPTFLLNLRRKTEYIRPEYEPTFNRSVAP